MTAESHATYAQKNHQGAQNASSEASNPSSTQKTFAALGIGPEVLEGIDALGWSHPTDVQCSAFGPVAAGEDVIVQSRTGTGKTGAFGIPLVDSRVTADGGMQSLILAPTRELARQSAVQIEALGKSKGISVASVYGGASMDAQIEALESGAQIVSGTPGRVLDLMRREVLHTDSLQVLVLDEADEMLSMGFARELHAIMEFIPKARQTLLFSATIDDGIQRMAKNYMKSPRFLCLSEDQVSAEKVVHCIYPISGKARIRDLANILDNQNPKNALIFCNTRAETDAVCAGLQRDGFSAEKLHGDVPQKERERVLAAMRADKVRFLVATDVAARGVDIPDLSHVINFACPESPETYVHRAGRTARAGRSGTAISLVSPLEIGSLYYLRLQYGIHPIERSLPTFVEQQTRLEADRVEVLEHAFSALPEAQNRAIARRLLTHPHAERIVAGLVVQFFGQSEGRTLDEVLAEMRRSRPAPAEQPVSEAAGAQPSGRHRQDRSDNRRPRSSGQRSRRNTRNATDREPQPDQATEPVAKSRGAREPAADAEPKEAGEQMALDGFASDTSLANDKDHGAKGRQRARVPAHAGELLKKGSSGGDAQQTGEQTDEAARSGSQRRRRRRSRKKPQDSDK